jgi:uncharacterized membrane protein YccC
MPENEILKKLDIACFLQLLSMYIIALLFFLFSKISHSWWVVVTTLMISGAIEPGLVRQRLTERFKGTFLGLMFIFPLIYLMHFNYRFVFFGLIISIILFHLAVLNPSRYDFSTFCITIFDLMFAAIVNNFIDEGPLQVLIDRGTATFIGGLIVLCGDYLLFNAYQYSRKRYQAYQKLIFAFLKETVAMLSSDAMQKNNFLLVTKLQYKMTEQYELVNISAQNLTIDSKNNPILIQKIENFQETILELRKTIFALHFSKFILQSQEKTQDNLIKYQELMHKAQENFI